ncbi:MAG: ATP-binding protein [Dehalococcoidales bacterium]|nr:ATP-binding protein [Dehalococcoidales bacterium]
MIISVASGKGGTGKTLIATSLALSLRDACKVRLLDCDVEEPNDHIFLNPVLTSQETVTIPVPEVDEEKCDHCGKCAGVCAYKAIAVWGKHIMVFSQLCHGCGACSYICPRKAISEQPRSIGIIESGHSSGIIFVHGKLHVGEAMAPPVIRKVKSYASSEEVTIIDSPPGTSCPVISTINYSDFCLLVTEPTPFGLNDLRLAVETVRELNIPCGVVINRSMAGENRVEEYCKAEDIPVLLSIPLDTGIARFYSRGITLVEGMPEWKQKFVELFEKIQETVNERSSCPER